MHLNNLGEDALAQRWIGRRRSSRIRDQFQQALRRLIFLRRIENCGSFEPEWELRMKTILNSGTIGVVVQLNFDATERKADPVSAHAVLKQFHLDEDGHVCLTASAGIQGFLDAIEILKSELDCIANQAVFWVAESVASRKSRISIVANDR
jgi:hypothetical protein